MVKQRPVNLRGMRFSPRKQRGVGVLDVLLGLLIAAIVLKGIVPWLLEKNTTTRVNIAASQAVAFREAALSFQQSNQAAIIAATGPSTPYTRTVAQLQAANALPASFSGTTPYGGTLIAVWNQPTAGVLQPVVIATGGAVINDGDLADIANAISAQGGEGAYIPSYSPTQLVCAQGSCNPIALSTYGYGSMGGHYAIAMFKGTQTSSDDFLHRHNDGVAAHGQMNQNIDMNGNAVNNAVAVNINSTGTNGLNITSSSTNSAGIAIANTSANRTWSFAVAGSSWGAPGSLLFYDNNAGALRAYMDTTGALNFNQAGNMLGIAGNYLYGDGANMALRTVANGGTVYIQGTANGGGTGNLSVQGTTYGGDFYTNGGSYRVNGSGGICWQNYGACLYMQDSSYVRILNDKNFYTGGQGQFGSLQSNSTIVSAGRVTSGEFILPSGVAWDGNWCDTNGLLAQRSDGSGALMNCQNHAWVKVKIGGNHQWYVVANYVNGNFTGHNYTNDDMFVSATSNGTSCGTQNNDYYAVAVVQGIQVASNIENNVNYYHQKSIGFMVPPGQDYQILWTRYLCNTQTAVYEYR
ncbi:shufflon system plasmid conjugative transfer pilus tip adhesin PilV (plasmid) [Dyella sp. BiH032]|uniref:shufflon system plasmid conjugative transfer pilus tip adhesin PilV n=1 Tax=Dyella sp. BiH032 TaxID=3075430 RepID=UPI002893732A|nr:shufflon system plasmid conjugative transfer pilus tip adhesin PilV [Dyella sp. BiH032]WNL48549.1 shufflon system plasmid conjugative transfer pilus tip adhesin PilV [Dyella sp. BiH032]